MIFLSHVLDSNTPTYGNRDRLSIDVNSEIIEGKGANTSSWHFSNNHMGTHMDTPFHFHADGRKTSDYEASEFFFTKVGIVEAICVTGVLLGYEDFNFKALSKDIELLIIKTGYGKYRKQAKYHNDNPGLAASAAGNLKKTYPKLRAVGFDFISLTSWNHRQEGRESHRAFLEQKNDFLIIEDMKLDEVSAQTTLGWVMVSPLRTSDGNGGPVTIIAKQQ